MSQYKTAEDKILYSERDLCAHLIQEHHEACHEKDLVRIAALCHQFEIAVYVAPPPPLQTSEQITAERKALEAAIADAARQYVDHRANAALQIELYDARIILNTALAANPTPEQLSDINTKLAMLDAVRNWGKAVYNEAEVNKAMALAGVSSDHAVLCDFTNHGDKPYTVYQLYVAGLVGL